jgi:hypothetical protein
MKSVIALLIIIKKKSIESEFKSVLAMDDINDLDKYYDTLNQIKSVEIFLKLKN